MTYPNLGLRGGAQAPDYEDLDYPERRKYAPSISINLPLTSTDMLSISGFITKGASNSTAAQDLDLFGTTYNSGTYLTSTFTLKSFKASLQDLLFPYPKKEGQRWRFKTLLEVQYDSIKTGINAPFAPVTDSSGNSLVTNSTGSLWVVYPTLGLGTEYHLTRNLEFDVNGSGFAIPHHAVIGDAQGTLAYRLGHIELMAGAKFYHVKTSPQGTEYFKTTLWGPYAALRWYPTKFSIPCPWCGRNTTAKNDTTSSSTPPPGGTLTVPPNGNGTSTSASNPPEPVYIRRISGGLTLSVLGLSPVDGGSSTVTNSSTVSTAYSSTAASERIGYGVTAQVAITDHFAAAIQALYRRFGFTLDTTITTTATTAVNGVVSTNSSSTSTHQDTRAAIIDIPAMLRYYNRGRHTPGPRWFVEGGGAFRDVISIRSSDSSTDVNGNLTCCTNAVVAPTNRTAKGMTAGGGFQFIDDFGIHVMPEVRYTRWLDPVFDSFSTNTQKNEVAAGLSLSF
jgi:outer membrane protein with beta-barrel domain